WAKYANHKRDAAVGAWLARRLGRRAWEPSVGAGAAARRIVMEGGSLDVNGRGTLLTTEECLLSPVQARNPGVTREQLEDVLGRPMPAPVRLDGVRLPASYANFYIGNAAVLVPTFNDPNDRRALGILADLFPDRRVVGIHAVDLVWGLGTLHCMTQQEPG